MVTPRLGWVLGSNKIYKTSDGVHWPVQFTAPVELGGLDFVTSTTGWVVGIDRLYGTTNGQTWLVLGEPSVPLRSVHFVNAHIGWGIAGGTDVNQVHGWLLPICGGRLVRSDNGGHSWTEVSAPPDLQMVCFSDASQGWLGTAEGQIYETNDGGTSWRMVLQSPYPPQAGFVVTLIECAAPHAVWVMFGGQGVALSHRPYIAYATQDGSNWRAVLKENYTMSQLGPDAPEGPDSYPGSFSVVDSSDAVFVGDGPASYVVAVVQATQGGAVLKRTGAIRGAWTTAGAAFLSISTGWVVADNTVQATSDGGYTWSRQLSVPH